MTIRSYQDVSPEIGSGVYIDEQASVIGDVHIGPDSSVWPFTVIRGDVNYIRIGSQTNIQDGSVLHVTHRYEGKPDGHPLLLGNQVTVGHKVILHGCDIRDQVLIGMGSTILDGAVIHSHALVGAGSLVTEGKELEGGYLWVGSPVRQVRELTEKEMNWFEYNASHYVRLKNSYLESGSG